MSVLDDAKRLAEHSVPEWQPGVCWFCSELLDSHASDCPWLSMPKIIAALEAIEQAQRQLVFLDHPDFRTDRLAVLSLADRVREILKTESA